MTVQRFFYYAVMSAFILLSCSSEKGADIQQTPRGEETGAESPAEQTALLHDAEYSMKIEPQEGFRNTAFRLSARNFELSNAGIQWMVNGVPVKGAEGMSFTPQQDAPGQRKGDTVQAKAVIDNKEVLSNIVKIKNAPPEFTRIKIMPEVFKPGDTLFVEAAANDADGDEVKIFYKWLKNGEPAGESMQIHSPLKRGDSISVTITPFDGEEYGSQVVFNRKIENLPPMIVEDMKFNFDGKIYTHQVRA
ncbi:MAG: hypothetical protein AB1306_02695, partial [Nitrospirota bacterium]